MGLKLIRVNAFTDKPFAGNPAVVCVLPGPRDEQWMQNVAREMNVSETAFLYRQRDGFNLRWFTPMVEVDLCGHATLASAHVLKEEGYLSPERQARFYTQSGVLTAAQQDGWIELDFPAEPVQPTTEPERLLSAIGVTSRYVGKNRLDYLVEVESEDILRRIKPNLSLLATLPVRGIIVTSPPALKGYDFISRVFAPKVGINEDPVTGSAHCCLGPFWQTRLQKETLLAHQASARGGIVQIHVAASRVRLSGQAVTVFRGELL